MKKITALAAILAIPAMAAPAGYFQVPGTETTMKVYGFVETQGMYEIDGNYGIGSGPGFDGPNEDALRNNQWSWRANGRLGFTTTTPSAWGDVVTKLELAYRHTSDKYAGADGRNGFDEMRHAYASVGGLLIGRTSTLFPDDDASPAAMDTDGLWADAWYCPGRVLTVRYTLPINKEMTAAFAFEQDKSSLDDAKTYLDPDDGLTNTYRDHHFPGSLVAAFTYAPEWGHIRAAVSAQKLSIDYTDPANPANNIDENKTAFSWNVGSHVNIGKGYIMAGIRSGVGYHGTGYLDNWYVNADGDGLEVVNDLAYHLSFGYPLTDTLTFNVGAGQVKWDKEKKVAAGSAIANADYKMTQGFVNLMWQATKQASFGAEYFFGKLEADGAKPWVDKHNVAQDSIKESRINLSAHFNFF